MVSKGFRFLLIFTGKGKTRKVIKRLFDNFSASTVQFFDSAFSTLDAAICNIEIFTDTPIF